MRGPGEHEDSRDNAVNGEGREAMFAYPGEEPGYGGPGDHERNDETDGQDNPAWESMCETPIAFSPLPITDFSKS